MYNVDPKQENVTAIRQRKVKLAPNIRQLDDRK